MKSNNIKLTELSGIVAALLGSPVCVCVCGNWEMGPGNDTGPVLLFFPLFFH